MITLKPYQLVPIKFMRKHRGLIIIHSLGSGKTLTSLYSMYQFSNDIVVVGTKNSKKTFIDNIIKADLDLFRFTFYSFAKCKILLESNPKLFLNKSVIVDEAHNLRSDKPGNQRIVNALSFVYKVVLLTATPIVNYLNDYAVLVNIVLNDNVLPEPEHEFNELYLDDQGTKFFIKNKEDLYRRLKNTTSYYKVTNSPDYPQYVETYIEVKMDKTQLKEYVYYIKKVLYDDDATRSEKNIFKIDFNLLASKKRNIFMTITRQLSNTVNNNPYSPKLISIYENIRKGLFPVVVYSNFIRNGLNPLAELLTKGKFSYAFITGMATFEEISTIANNYNNNKYDVLLISSAGAESLDLKNTRAIHIMEPFWNEAKIKQVIGRVVRYKSHDALPKNERFVNVYHWISIFPDFIQNESADQYLISLSNKKRLLWKAFEQVLIDVSI